MIINPYRFGAPPAATTTWDPAVKGGSVVLSNGNLDATKAAVGFQTAFATNGRNSGRYAFEVLVTALPSIASILIGIADKTNPSNVTIICAGSLGTQTSDYLESIGYNDFNGRIFKRMTINNINGTTTTSYTVGDIITVDVDIAANTVAFLKNGVATLISGSATTAITSGRTWFPGISLQQAGVGRLVVTGLTHLPAGATEWG